MYNLLKIALTDRRTNDLTGTVCLITLKNAEDALRLVETKKKQLETEYSRLEKELGSLQTISISEGSILAAEKALERKKSYYHIFVN